MQNIISANSNEVTMTSLELVEYINSQRNEGDAELQHKHFCEKVSKVLGEKRSAELLADLPDSYGRPRKGFRFPKREACLMAMSYSYDLQAKVFDRMTELEHKQQYAIPTTLSEALRLAADIQDQKDKAEAALAIAAPKADALDRIALADGMLHLQAAGKVLQQQPNKFIQWLREINWIYKRPGNANNYPRADKANAGYMTVKAVTITQQDGTDRTREQTYITPKGLAKLSMMLGVEPDMFGGV